MTVGDLAAEFATNMRGGADPATEEPALETEGELPDDERETVVDEDAPETESTELDPDTEETLVAEDEEVEEEETLEPYDELRAEMLDAIETAGLPKGQEKLVKRIHALVDERERGKRELAAAQEELEQVKRTGPSPQGLGTDYAMRSPEYREVKDGLAYHQARIERADQLLQQLNESGEDHLELKGEDGDPVQLTEQFIQAEKAKSKEQLDELKIDEKFMRRELKKQFAASVEHFEREAAELYPWTADPKAKEWKEAEAVLEMFPELKQRDPGWKKLLGGIVYLRTQVWNQPPKGQSKPKIATRKRRASKPTPQTITPSSNQPKPPSEREKLRRQANKTGSVKDLAEEFKVQLRR